MRHVKILDRDLSPLIFHNIFYFNFKINKLGFSPFSFFEKNVESKIDIEFDFIVLEKR